MSDIEELKFDDKNFNKHTEYGMGLLEKSLREFGAGRSILVDKNNNIIAGNGIVESAINAGIKGVKVVESDGTELVAVKRTDIDLHTKRGRRMALADNATASADLEWDDENIRSELGDEDLEDWGVDLGNDDLYLSVDELQDINPLPDAYTQRENVENFEFGRSVQYDDKYEELKKKAGQCQNPELKKLLERRLKDFSDFDFAYIADFYQSGASEEEKDLIEEFGLVIPCEKRALELGFIDLEQSVALGKPEL